METLIFIFHSYMWVFPKIGVFPPKWMVKIMEKPMNPMDDLEGKRYPYFQKHPNVVLAGPKLCINKRAGSKLYNWMV